MKKSIIILVALFILVIGMTGVIEAKQSKLDVCHLTGKGKIVTINVAEAALKGHSNHGDYLPETFYADSDGDGYGNPDYSMTLCEMPDGFVEDNTDCDDSDADINLPYIFFEDADGDGYGNPDSTTEACELPEGYVDDDTDCDDTDADVNLPSTFYEDADGDGYGNAEVTTEACEAPDGYVDDDTDCDDTDPNEHLCTTCDETATEADCWQGTSCADLPWAIYKDGLYWAWASPCSGGCSQIYMPIPNGWRFATPEEWQGGAGGPQTAAEFNYQCAAPYFDPKYNHCDSYNLERGQKVSPEYPYGRWWETILVHDVDCE